MKSLRRTLFVRYAVLVSAVLVAVALLMVLPLHSFAVDEEKDRLEEEARLFALEFRRFFTESTPPPEIDAYLEYLAKDHPTRLTVIDAGGVVLGDSEVPAGEMENHAGRPEVAAALEGNVGSAVRESRTLGKGFIYAAAPIWVNGEIAGVVRVASEEKDVTPALLHVWWIFLGAFGFLLLVIIAAGVWTERTIMGGLRGMREAAAGLASGDLGRRVAEPDIKDFSDLARDFNVMAEQVRHRVEEAAAERGKLEAVLDNISAGVMVTDSESRIVMLNPAAEIILGVKRERAEGRRIIEVFSSRELDVTVARAAAGENIEAEIELLYPRRMFLHVKSNPVTASDGRVIATVSAIEDVTAVKRLDRVRQDFVANVSHELRTPVATIRALTDSLLDGAVEQRDTAERFLRDLDHEATRLSQLIEDLLALSKLEAEGAVMEPGDFQLGELMRECLESKSKLAEDYGVTMETKIPEAGPMLHADRRLLGAAVNNLIDNAVKYNRPGGVVSIAGSLDKDDVVIEVGDNGIGIPGDELPRVFERFYRVDKARSRETGGTGLGLSIVKHIVDLHGGTVGVTSVEGEGSVFRITIPAPVTKN
jgi:two-component system phosphate regulon sensor histidine kinase PhoR